MADVLFDRSIRIRANVLSYQTRSPTSVKMRLGLYDAVSVEHIKAIDHDSSHKSAREALRQSENLS